MTQPGQESIARRGAGSRNERVQTLDATPLDAKPEITPSDVRGRDGDVLGSVVQGDAPPAKPKKWRYIGEARHFSMPPTQGIAGYMTKITPGAEFDELNFNMKNLAAQGISVERKNLVLIDDDEV